jgi:CRP-like cAMP-binding protein
MQELIDSGIFKKQVELKRNEYLKEVNSVDTNIYYIESGSLRIFIVDENEERNIRFGYSGNIIVSLDSFISGNPSDFIIQTIKQTKLLTATRVDFMNFISKSEESKRIYEQILEDLVLQQIEREKDLLTNSPKLRYERVLKRSPRVFQEIPHKHIANYLRMTPETLSRLKKS